MKKTFAARTFRAWSFRAGTWAGRGVIAPTVPGLEGTLGAKRLHAAAGRAMQFSARGVLHWVYLPALLQGEASEELEVSVEYSLDAAAIGERLHHSVGRVLHDNAQGKPIHTHIAGSLHAKTEGAPAYYALAED